MGKEDRKKIKKITRQQFVPYLYLCKMARSLVDETYFGFTITPAENFQKLVNRQVVAVWTNVLQAFGESEKDRVIYFLIESSGQCSSLRYLYSMARYKSYINDDEAVSLIQQSADYIAEINAVIKRIEEI